MRIMELTSPVPRMIEITMEIAKTRTPSASARRIRNVPAVSLRIPLSESPLHQFVGGEHLAAKIVREEREDMMIRASK